MSKKHTLKKTGALLLGLALTVGSTGCNFFPTDNQKDLAQVVATVNIYETLKKDDEACASAINTLIKNDALTSDVYKSDLVAYFMNVGYTYVQNYGYSYEDTFNMLMDGLVNTKIMIQYAVAYYLQNGLSVEGCQAFVDAELAKVSAEEKKLLEANPEVLTMKYFLTENGENPDDYNLAVYSLMKSLNSSLDSLEASYIEAEDEEHSHSEARTTPTAISTEKEDYYPEVNGEIDYAVYTGRNALDACGEYEKIEGSTTSTRKKAYNAFLSNLQEYGLVGAKENTSDVTKLDYYYVELSSSLGQALINKYFDALEEKALEGLTSEYISAKYTEIQEAQKNSYRENASAFETAIGGLSDDSFVLYGSEGFGFVYNILIPFSTAQQQAYSAAQNKGLTDNERYSARREILKGVQAKDLRDSWFDLHDHANYAYEATENYFDNGSDKGEKTYLFFEDSMVETKRYEALTQYAGMYPYNGTVEEGEDEYTFKANKMDIDGFVAEMEGFINYVVSGDATSGKASGKKIDAYETTEYVDEKNVVDYSKFMYYEGKVNLENTNAADYFKAEDNDAYKALSAVNELMFAYSTDTGCLNTYMGYAVSPNKTNFVPEFEYAAQYAVKQGVGSYVVCATDYGWHIIYVSFVYGEGDVYGGYNAAEKDVEGSFSNLFYESLKATTSSNYSNEIQNNVLNAYNNESNVTLYKSRYQDLLDMEA